ncbi:hypothetical protein BUALT_Bualt14G0061800 [Buddleja alternifolia]|uniref:Disease resistance protein winged helix domain-containing protein n=1 Tax=Buddleja alternifolia TaxID=168488 RepID=A0AAV6WI83_9LAMI|nr:hypothetical protein BUALT_Bualt14G0061800 [Buddleja alternifolia]
MVAEGLPLAIDVIGGLLKKDKVSKDFWEHVANDVSSTIAEKDEKFSDILSLSYNHLPYHLKPCFLYMRAFPGDHQIRASALINLWVAEGFLKSIGGDKSLEEAAEGYLNALVDRNLLLIQNRKSNGKAKDYVIHDLLRDLCVRKACLRRVNAHPSYRIRDIYASVEYMSLARSFLCTGLKSRAILSPVFLALRLLRVLEVIEMEFQKFPTEILQLVNLLYLSLCCHSGLPSAISRLWNLQTLCSKYGTVADETYFPILRHLVIRDCPALEESPSGIGEIPTLEIMEVDESDSSLVASTRQILDEQTDYGNYGIEIHILLQSKT